MSGPATPLSRSELEILTCACKQGFDEFCPFHTDRMWLSGDVTAEVLQQRVEQIISARFALLDDYLGNRDGYSAEMYAAAVECASRGEAS